jgi:hypothetical protein
MDLPPSIAPQRPLVGPWPCLRCQLAIRPRTGATMTPVKVCSICNGAIVGFGNIAEPIRTGRCCDRCYWETVVPERVRRPRARCQAGMLLFSPLTRRVMRAPMRTRNSPFGVLAQIIGAESQVLHRRCSSKGTVVHRAAHQLAARSNQRRVSHDSRTSLSVHFELAGALNHV